MNPLLEPENWTVTEFQSWFYLHPPDTGEHSEEVREHPPPPLLGRESLKDMLESLFLSLPYTHIQIIINAGKGLPSVDILWLFLAILSSNKPVCKSHCSSLYFCCQVESSAFMEKVTLSCRQDIPPTNSKYVLFIGEELRSFFEI